MNKEQEFINKITNNIELAKENGCKLLDCKTIDRNIKLQLEVIRLHKEVKEKTTIIMAGAEKVKKLEQENEELNNQYDDLSKLYDDLFDSLNDCIDKQVIKDKIKELENLEKSFNFSGLITECETKINALKELLGE